MTKPREANGYLEEHAARLISSYAHWTGKDLVPAGSIVARARRLFHAPYAALSHDTEPDPILNYANQSALALFELTWEELIRLPSRRTAEPVEQAERERLLATVAERGYIDNYRGVRVTRTGRRFMIERATVWNLLDEDGGYYGQAAMFSDWKYLGTRHEP
ncbi:MAG TPA: MEKHLA domain-containing protein [Candidatus Binatia bacterium]